MSYIFDVKVIPSSGKNLWKLSSSGELRCYLKSPPEKGLANKELIKLIGNDLGIAQESVEIIAGATNRTKRVKIHKKIESLNELLELLNIHKQSTIF